MALPKIQPYALPTASELPGSKPQWIADRSRVALLVHDMQNYFIRSFTPASEPVTTVVSNINRLRALCENMGIPVFYTAQPGDQNQLDRGLQRFVWGSGMSSADNNPDIFEDVSPASHETVVTKWRYSAFQRTSFTEMMNVRKLDQLIITGVYAHIGCLLTAADAFMKDIEPFFVADAVADFSREKHDDACKYVSGHIASVLTTEQLILQLSGKSQ